MHQSYLRDYRACKRSGHRRRRHAASRTRPGPHAGRGAGRRIGGARLKTTQGRVAAITGAGSGIGRALAGSWRAAAHTWPCRDIDEAGLAETVARCEGRLRNEGHLASGSTSPIATPSTPGPTRSSPTTARSTSIFNNAGVGVGATVESMSYDDFKWLMSINFWGVVHGTKAFLPHLKAAGGGHVVNLSSVFGLFAVPSQSAYNAAKFAVRGFTDALRMELEIEGAACRATTVHPGGIKHQHRPQRPHRRQRRRGWPAARPGASEFDKLARTTPEKAARQIVAAVEANKRRALIGPDAKVLDLLSRLPAGAMQRAMIKGARRRVR